MPRVTLLLLFGIIIGDQALDLIPLSLVNQINLVTDMALLVVGFLLGGQFNLVKLRDNSRGLIWISASAEVFTVLAVTISLFFTPLALPLIFLLGCIASATAPTPIITDSPAVNPLSH